MEGAAKGFNPFSLCHFINLKLSPPPSLFFALWEIYSIDDAIWFRYRHTLELLVLSYSFFPDFSKSHVLHTLKLLTL